MSTDRHENEVLRLTPEDVEELKNGGEAHWTRYNEDKEKIGRFVVRWEDLEAESDE